MARLPDVSRIAQSVTTATDKPVVEDFSTGASFAQILTTTAATAVDNFDQYKQTQAEADFLLAESEMKRNIGKKGDDDYTTYDERYTTALQSKMNDLASGFINPVNSADFTQRMNQRIDTSRSEIQNLAWNREVDVNRADIATKTTAMKEAAITANSPEDVQALTETFVNHLHNGAANQYMSEQEVQTQIEKWQQSVAAGRFKLMPEDVKGQALNSTWMKKLPATVQADLKEEWQNSKIKSESFAIVDRLPDDPTAALSVLGKIKNTKLREAAESRWNFVSAQRQKVETMSELESFEKYGYSVANGETDVATIQENDPDAWTLMGDENNRRLLAFQKAGGVTKGDGILKRSTGFGLTLEKQIQLHISDGNYKAANDLLNRNDFINNVKGQHQLDYNNAILKMVKNEPVELSTGVTESNMITNIAAAFGGIKINAVEHGKVQQALSAEKLLRQQSGKEMTEVEKRDFVKLKFVELKADPTAMFFEESEKFATINWDDPNLEGDMLAVKNIVDGAIEKKGISVSPTTYKAMLRRVAVKIYAKPTS